MKNIITWKNAGKLAIILGIIGGLYTLYQLFDFLLSDDIKFETEISITEYPIPKNKSEQYFREDIKKIIPSRFQPYYLSRDILDTLKTKLDLSKINAFTMKDFVESAIPEEFDQLYLVEKIDSLIKEETYILRNTKYFISTVIKNNSDRIVKELRFELPARGYFEISINDDIVNEGKFNNNIYIGELRPKNYAKLKIWSINYVSYYQVSENEIKYTFDKGFLVPTLLDSIKAEGLIYWIYHNTLFAIYLFIFLPINLAVIFILYLKDRRNREKCSDTQTVDDKV